MSGPNLWPLPRRTPRLGPEDWGLGMTLCIAAISERDRCIVTVSDLMLSTDFMSSEAGSMMKSDVIPPHHRWIMLFAGDPVQTGYIGNRSDRQHG